MYKTSSKQIIDVDVELGKGGEGVVYSLQRNMIHVAKIYHDSHRTTEKEQKLQAMIANPPSDDTRQFNPPHISIAWPEELIYENRKFAGYLMPKIMTSPEIFEVFSPVTRKKKYPNFDWRYAHRAAQNLAIALNALHARNCVMGDVNQKNILVTDQALITLVDTDSFQVTDSSGRVYRCPVGVPEYTPPELQGVSLGTVNRFEYHDNFGLAVLIFQLLMDGNHPFMGVPQNLQQSFGKVDQHCIKQGIFPYQTNRDFMPPPHAPRFESLHPDLQRLFLQTFVKGYKTPAARTDALDWANAIETAENALVQCQKNPAHWYSNHSPKCHWCEREKRGGVVPTQKPLTPSTPAQQPIVPVKQTPIRKATVSTRPPAKNSSSFSWGTAAWAIFAIFIFWLGARAISVSSATSASQNATAQAWATLDSATAQAQAKSGTATAQSRAISAQSTATSLQKQATKVFGPENGKIIHDPNDNSNAMVGSEMDLKNFIMEARVYNPYSIDVSPWTFAVDFRQTYPADNAIYLYVNSDGTWSLSIDSESKWNVIASGVISNINTASNGSNKIRLIVFNEIATFYINDVYVDVIDISGNTHSGDIELVAALEVVGKTTRYADFTVFGLDAPKLINAATANDITQLPPSIVIVPDINFESVSFSPDSTTFAATGCCGGGALLYDLAKNKEISFPTFNADGTHTVSFNSTGTILFTGSADPGGGKMRAWDWKKGKELWSVKIAPQGSGVFVSSSPDNKWLVTSVTYDGVILWKMGNPPQQYKTISYSGGLASFSPRGNWIGFWEDDIGVHLYNITTEEEKFLEASVSSGYFSKVAFSPDGSLVAAGDWKGVVRIWRVKDGSVVKTINAHKDWVHSIAFSPSGDLLATGANDNLLKLWRVSDGKLLKTLGDHQGRINSIAFSPDGKFLASVDQNGFLIIWGVVK